MTYDQSYMRSHYRDVFTIAMRCGENMAQNGAEAFRVEDTAIRILKTTGFAYAEAHVSVTGLILSLDDPSMPHEITLVKRIQDRTSNLLQISRTNDISRRFVEGQLSVEDAQKELDALKTAATYPAWLVALAITCVGPFFTLMFNGTFYLVYAGIIPEINLLKFVIIVIEQVALVKAYVCFIFPLKFHISTSLYMYKNYFLYYNYYTTYYIKSQYENKIFMF